MDADQLADEAERGYDVSQLGPGRDPKELRRHTRVVGDESLRFVLDGLGVANLEELHELVEKGRMTDYLDDRGAILSTAVGIARMALLDDDPALARAELDDACKRTHNLMFDHAIALGHPLERVEMLYGPRDES